MKRIVMGQPWMVVVVRFGVARQVAGHVVEVVVAQRHELMSWRRMMRVVVVVDVMRILEHFVVEPTVDDAVPHAKDVALGQRLYHKLKEKMSGLKWTDGRFTLGVTWLHAAQMKQTRWKTASRALMTSSLDPSGRQQRLQRFAPNNLRNQLCIASNNIHARPICGPAVVR